MAKAQTKTTALVPRKTTSVSDPSDWRAIAERSAKRAVAQAVNTSENRWIKTSGGRFTYRDLVLNDIECIILDKVVEHAYYDTEFDPDNPTNPACFALSFDPEDMVPNEKSTSKQADACVGCPQFEWGSAEKGRGKACKEIRRVAILAMPDTVTPESIAEAEIAFVKIPVMSVKGVDQFFAHIAGQGASPWMYKSRLKIVPDPKSQYRVIAELADPRAKPFSEKVYPAIAARVTEAEKELERPYEPRDDEGFEDNRHLKNKAKKGKAPAGKKKF